MMATLRRDPALFVHTCAIWALINAASLLLAGHTFQLAAAYYQEIVRFGLREHWVGCAMLADGAALLLTVSWGSAGLRSFVAIASAPAWCFYGTLMLISAARAGLFTVAGAYDVAVGLGLTACGAHWAHTLPHHCEVIPRRERPQSGLKALTPSCTGTPDDMTSEAETWI